MKNCDCLTATLVITNVCKLVMLVAIVVIFGFLYTAWQKAYSRAKELDAQASLVYRSKNAR